MAIVGGVLESQNLRDLANENTPGWLDQDDRVLAWVKHHAIQDIAALSAAQKVAMVRTLADGWIAEDDVAGIVRMLGGEDARTREELSRSDLYALSGAASALQAAPGGGHEAKAGTLVELERQAKER